MDKEVINPGSFAKPVGYNNGILVKGGKLLFLAGQPALDAAGQIIGPGDLVAQFQQAFSNIKSVVEAAGGTPTDIVKLTIYVTDKAAYVSSRQSIGRVYREYFGKYYPAVTLVEVKDLFDTGAMVELDAIAAIPENG
jgi:enamine deaminase RidA (YjgF/YER057c/UK114 family)